MIIISVILSAGITVVLGYFLLPVIFPNITEEPPTYVDEGILVQSIYLEANTQAYINDVDTTYEKVPDTELNITIEDNSRILASFCSVVTLHIGPNFDISMNFFIVLDINGVDNRTLRIHFYDNSGPYGAIREFTHNTNMVLQTEVLTAGTYTVSVYWKSEFDATGDSQLILSSPMGNRTRSLLVQEII